MPRRAAALLTAVNIETALLAEWNTQSRDWCLVSHFSSLSDAFPISADLGLNHVSSVRISPRFIYQDLPNRPGSSIPVGDSDICSWWYRFSVKRLPSQFLWRWQEQEKSGSGSDGLTRRSTETIASVCDYESCFMNLLGTKRTITTFTGIAIRSCENIF